MSKAKLPLVAARDAIAGPQIILPAIRHGLINPLAYANARALGGAAFSRWLHWCNAARDTAQPAVQLGCYDKGTLLDGGGPFQLLTDGALVREQGGDAPANAARWRGLAANAVDVDRPCLLACHPGEWTWGHWLIDTLPKIVLAERHAPQRFTYVVPAGITDPASGTMFVANVLQSLAAYGVTPGRLLRVHPGTAYRFANLFDIADHVAHPTHASLPEPHPGIIPVMQSLTLPAGQPRPLTAILRRGPEWRPLLNLPAIEAVLAGAGAGFLDPGATPFIQQVAAFRDSDIIAGDLGSNLAACIYARPGTGFVTLGPLGWTDSYFVNLFQRLGLFHADVRGVSLAGAAGDAGHAAHAVDPLHVSEAILAVQAARAAPNAPPVVEGRVIARAPGPVVWRLRFGQSGNAANFQASSFSPPEPHGTWSLGPNARILIPGFHPPGQDCWLSVQGSGYAAEPCLASTKLDVSVNGVLLAGFDVAGLTHVHVPVPASVLALRPDLEIGFSHKVCPSPQSLGLSGDTRPLGFMFETVALLVA